MTGRYSATVGFGAPQAYATGPTPVSVTVVGSNHAALPDIVVANSGDHTISVLPNQDAYLVSGQPMGAQQLFDAGATATFAAAADFNGDQKSDLVVAHASDNSVSVLLNAQYQTQIAGSPATVTLVHDYLFADGFE
jgi:hypothetical protein